MLYVAKFLFVLLLISNEAWIRRENNMTSKVVVDPPSTILEYMQKNLIYHLTPCSGACNFVRNSKFLEWSGGFVSYCMHKVIWE